MKQGKRTGRPAKEAAAGTRVSLGLKVTPAIKNAIDKVARENGRTQSQEAELRLERSFERESLLLEALELAYGGPIAGFLVWLGSAMRQTAMREAYKRGAGNVAPGDEIIIPEVREQVGLAVETMGRWLRGKGLPEGKGVGVVVAAGILDELEHPKYLKPSPGNQVYIDARDRLAPILPTAEESK